MTGDFPAWLVEPWRRLADAYRQDRLPHAILLAGQDGVGKRVLADRLAALLLCEHDDGKESACGRCTGCTWLKAGTHPDLSTLSPEEEGKAIKVGQVRSLIAELGMTSHAGGYKVALIAPAEAMNVNAANSLLKTLEEPTAGTLLILLTSAPGRLPATIRSRCQLLRIPVPPAELALDWLEHGGVDRATALSCLRMSAGGPLAAAELASSDSVALRERRLTELTAILSGKLDPLRVANDWTPVHEGRTLQWWQSSLQALILWRQLGQVPDEPSMAQMLRQITEDVDCRQLFELSDRVTRAVNSLGSGLNRQLLLEDLLIDWARLAGKPVRQSTAPGR